MNLNTYKTKRIPREIRDLSDEKKLILKKKKYSID